MRLVFSLAIFGMMLLHHTTTNDKTNTMKEFSLLVRVPVSYTTQQAKEVNPQWDKVLNDWKASGVYVTSFAFPGESFIVYDTDKLVKKETVVANGLKVVSNIVLRATTIDDAITLAKDCPILQYGGTVEVRAIISPPVKAVD